nr:isopentenyl phosphate kinase-like [Lolium perenne]
MHAAPGRQGRKEERARRVRRPGVCSSSEEKFGAESRPMGWASNMLEQQKSSSTGDRTELVLRLTDSPGRPPSSSAIGGRRLHDDEQRSSHGGGSTRAAEPRNSPPRPLYREARCSVLSRGAAITNKGELESIDEGSLRSSCAQLRQAMSGDATPGKVMGMDWSRRPGDPADPAVDTEGFRDMAGLGIDTNFIVVHGAGSFGHFQASRSGVHKGGLHTTLVKAGFVATRISVTSLNQEVVRALARGTLHGNEDYCTLC